MLDFDVVFKFIAPVTVPIVSAAIAFIKERANYKEISEAIKRENTRIAFWRSYYETRVLIEPKLLNDPFRQEMITQLCVSADAVRVAQEREASRNIRFQRPESFIRRSFLIYLPPQPWIWLLRLIFYYYFVYTILATIIIPLKWFAKGNVTNNQIIIYAFLIIAVYTLKLIIQYIEDVVIRKQPGNP